MNVQCGDEDRISAGHARCELGSHSLYQFLDVLSCLARVIRDRDFLMTKLRLIIGHQ